MSFREENNWIEPMQLRNEHFLDFVDLVLSIREALRDPVLKYFNFKTLFEAKSKKIIRGVRLLPFYLH